MITFNTFEYMHIQRTQSHSTNTIISNKHDHIQQTRSHSTFNKCNHIQHFTISSHIQQARSHSTNTIKFNKSNHIHVQDNFFVVNKSINLCTPDGMGAICLLGNIVLPCMYVMADELREEIRACVREDLEQNAARVSRSRTLVQRTRSLIQASASSASRSLRTSPLELSNLQGAARSSAGGTSKQTAPGHSLRYGSKKTEGNCQHNVTSHTKECLSSR